MRSSARRGILSHRPLREVRMKAEGWELLARQSDELLAALRQKVSSDSARRAAAAVLEFLERDEEHRELLLFGVAVRATSGYLAARELANDFSVVVWSLRSFAESGVLPGEARAACVELARLVGSLAQFYGREGAVVSLEEFRHALARDKPR